MVILPSERKLSRRWRTVDRCCSIGVDRQWCQNMGWAYFMIAEARNQTQITRIPFDDQKSYFTVSKPLLTAMLLTILERESLGLEREICTPWEREDLEFPLFLTLFCFYLSIGYYSDHHNYVLCEYVWVVLAVRFRFLNRLIYVILHRRVRCLAMDGDLPTVRLSPSFDTK